MKNTSADRGFLLLNESFGQQATASLIHEKQILLPLFVSIQGWF